MARRLIFKEGGLTGSIPSGYQAIGFNGATFSQLTSAGSFSSGASGVAGTSGTSGASSAAGAASTSGTSAASSDTQSNRYVELRTYGGTFSYFTSIENAVSSATSGDTIIVYPGTYSIATTATNGIAKSGVNYYFHQGAIVNKSSSGHLFNDSGFSSPINIGGSGTFNLSGSAGSFCVLTKETSEVSLYTVTSSSSSAIFDLSSLVGGSSGAVEGTGKTTIRVNYALSTGGVVLRPNSSTSAAQISVFFNTLKSTASYVISGGNQTKLNLVGNLIYSTATHAIYDIWNYSVVTADVREILGVSYGWYLPSIGSGAFIQSTAKTNGIYFAASDSYFYQNSHCDTFYITGGLVYAKTFVSITQTSGYFSGEYFGSNLGSAFTISGGVSKITFANRTVNYARLSFSITGGKVFFDGYYQEDYYTRNRVVNGATAELIFNNCQFISTATGAGEPYGGMFTLTNGKIRFNNCKISQGLTTTVEPLVKWSAGTIICNGLVATGDNQYTSVFQATNSSLNLKVLGGGLSTNLISNGGTIAAKKLKYKLTVNTVTTTSLTLNDGTGGNETFTESNTGTYNTLALLAQRMTSLINASGTLDITASQDSAGTDTYFYIEMDTAGPSFTGSFTNLTSLQVCLNSYAINSVITGGAIIEDTDVE